MPYDAIGSGYENPWETLEWFDIHNDKHLKAWQEMQTTGLWPEWFKPFMGKLPHMWESMIKFLMSEAWVKAKIGG